ncbi:LOW QUALITY PROTEIN: cingulin-like protein 1 [Erpetoichthys calabaricus]|uniref:LOW QUALITY PROTEIN: cingulin-like protein 1 n=1 Tax=Erpetoichthys calabaricus TaxID=27687 RepID=UPI002234761B|nr:LOW QUALITY PROTEIN: cingulin-like protein 1 [Erpetoichthys calabaricus]
MDSYKLAGDPSSQLRQDYLPYEHSGRLTNKPGSYGVSIRVQGIDGHPYVVLNNRDRQFQTFETAAENGYSDSSRDVHRTLSSKSNEYDSMKNTTNGEVPHSEVPHLEYKSQKHMLLSGSQNGSTEFKQSSRKTATLLNFQRHPELLKPYDPEKNTLNLGGFPTVPAQVSVTSDKENKENKQWDTLPKTSSSLKFHHRPSVESENLKQSKNGPVTTAPSVFQFEPPIKLHNSANNSGNSLKLVSGSSSVVSSANSSLEHKKTRPDVLPLRRQESSGPVLDASRSRRSSASSTTPTSICSSNKFGLEDQDDALCAENVNRHENRRYIPFLPGTGRDIDTGSIPAVDELIDKFDGKDSPQRRGRSGRRNRINPEDRKRSRSVDSAFPFGLQGESEYLDEFSRSQGRSTEHLLRPSQLRQQNSSMRSDTVTDGVRANRLSYMAKYTSTTATSKSQEEPNYQDPMRKLQDKSGADKSAAYNVSRSVLNRNSALPYGFKGAEEKSVRSVKVLSTNTAQPSTTNRNLTKATASEQDVQACPDLLKGQQDLAQQTNEETAKQILFNYLKDGSNDNDDATKKKVNLVFEKIQTLKSRAAGSMQTDNKTLESPSELKALQEQKSELEKTVVELEKKLEQEAKNHQTTLEAKKREKANKTDLQKSLEESLEESNRLREQLAKTEKDLRTTVEELFQVKMEREQCQTEVRDLQDQLSEMHDELDASKQARSDSEEKQVLMKSLLQMKQELEDVVFVKEEQEEMLRKRERELTALKGALKEEVSCHDKEIDRLKEQHDMEMRKLKVNLDEATQNHIDISKEKTAVEEARIAAESRVKQLTEENERLRKRILALEAEIVELNKIIDQTKKEENKGREKIARLEKEKSQLEETMNETKECEHEILSTKRVLENRLEEAQRNLNRLNHENRELNEHLKEERSQKEQFKRTKNEIEDERRQLDRTVEKLQKEMNEIVEASQKSTLDLQFQIDEYKEKNRKEMTDLQRQLKDKNLELEKCRIATKKLQDEISFLEEDIKQCKKERDEAVFKAQHMEQKAYDLEIELENRTHTKDDRSRQVKSLEDKISQLEMELEEERSSGDLLMDRVDRGREQLEQMRSELLQERATRQDLECDKTSLERQNKDLKSRLSHLEGFQRSSKEGIVSQLESRVLELEEQLERDERDRASLQLANRKLERKVKELMMQVDDERTSLTDQKDQLNLRLKALKRQVDEAEEEIERLEHSKKKLQRELDEQAELNDQLQGQLNTLRKDARRKSTSTNVLNELDDDDDDDMSTDGESLYAGHSGYTFSHEDALRS